MSPSAIPTPSFPPRPIGIFDSGIGGLSVAEAMAELMPHERFLYVSDNARAPYGPQSPRAILTYSREITRYLLGQGAKMIVVACNTATSLAIDHLRKEFAGVEFVGLEPALKPAASDERVGVMATAATMNSKRYVLLREKYLAGKTIVENDCRGLVPVIESFPAAGPEVRAKLEVIVRPMLAAGVQSIVLGCTHYPLVQAAIRDIAGGGVRVIDPSPAAARQARRILRKLAGEAGLAPDGKEPALVEGPHLPRTTDFLCTGGSAALQRTLLHLPALNRRRRWVLPNHKLPLR